MADLTLSAQPRQLVGRKVIQLRNRGLTPVVVYGKTQQAQSLQVDERFLRSHFTKWGSLTSGASKCGWRRKLQCLDSRRTTSPRYPSLTAC